MMRRFLLGTAAAAAIIAGLSAPSQAWLIQGGTNPPGDPPGGDPPPDLVPGFYVATAGGGGSDSNAGTLASPFLTIDKCQTEMQGSATKKTCYIRAGTYTYTSGSGGCGGSSQTAIIMSTSDNGETLSYYPPDGPGTAFITGGGTVNSGICLSGTGITINGLDVGNFVGRAIVSTNTNNTIKNNTAHGTTEVNSNGEIFLDGNVQGNLVTHNYVYNCSNNGIEAHPGSPNELDGVVISYNFVRDCTKGCSDCGSIYTQDVFGSTGSTTYITNNYVRDIAANEGSPGSKAIYLDDGSSGHVVTGNVMQPGANGWACVHLHGGHNNTFTGNICDQNSSSDFRIVFYQTSNISGGSTMAGNRFNNNVIVTSTSSTGNGYTLDGSPTQRLSVNNNNYYGYGSATPSHTGSGATGSTDSNWVNVNPNFTCGWTYVLPSNSPVYNSPTLFPAQPAGWGTAGYWGPPGFTIPRTGTVPSPPHSC